MGATGALALVGACASPTAKAPTPSPQPPPPAAPVAPASPPAPAPAVSVAPAPPADTCGAQPLQYLVGKPRTEIPVPLTPGNRRVVCTTCAVTQDHRAYRQTITYDSQTGLVTSVKCG
jgi:hypothetical protein